ncbi:MAG: prolipoprotein diacylglyceryl transferase [Kiritimatiellia bacterium]|nr:prolipoprotein diacylglyceryl transferase [Lentisphaerota bacterium]
MHPICFYIGNRPVYWYGIMMAIAFVAAIGHWNWLARRENRPANLGSDIALWLMLAGIIGARINYVLANLSDFAQAPLTVLRIDQGGLIYYGGFVGAALAALWYARRHQENPWWLADFIITALPLGHFFGRIGCFLNGCCYGRAGSGFGSYRLERVERIPVQLYESAWNLLIYLILCFVFLRRKKNGLVFSLYLILYPTGRFVLEFWRGDPRQTVWHLTVAQIFSLFLLVIGTILLLRHIMRPIRPDENKHG